MKKRPHTAESNPAIQKTLSRAATRVLPTIVALMMSFRPSGYYRDNRTNF